MCCEEAHVVSMYVYIHAKDNGSYVSPWAFLVAHSEPTERGGGGFRWTLLNPVSDHNGSPTFIYLSLVPHNATLVWLELYTVNCELFYFIPAYY